MIIGNGLLANGFRKHLGYDDNIVLFASGVSNSSEIETSEFEREKKLLTDIIKRYPEKLIVYFSSCALENNEVPTKYYSHKLEMEALIKENSNIFYIFRLPQLVGKTKNKNTLINFLFSKISTESKFSIWKYATRNLIDIDDVISIVQYMLVHKWHQNSIINIASPIEYSILEIVRTIEIFLNKKAIYTTEDKGDIYKININPIRHMFFDLNINFNDNYLKRLLEKYYSSER